MARNERVGQGWPQPRRSTSSKSHSTFIGSRRPGNLDDLGDIMSLLSNCNKGKTRKEQWPIHCSSSSSRTDCCLKNGRIHCSCLWSKNDFSLDNQSSCRRNYRKTSLASDTILPHERNLPFWHENNNSSSSGGIKMAEEYVLDDNELCFDFYDMPFDMPKRHQLRKVGNVKTVSIIDTLSELASGATDREDEGGFSSAVSESAILGHDPYRSRIKYARHSSSRRGHGHRANYLTLTPMSNEFRTKGSHRPQLNDSLSAYHESICGSQIQNLHGDDGNFTCSSLKRTLKYLRKAVSSNVVEEEPRTRRHHIRRYEEKDAFRQCFSDSEVREIPKPWSPVKREKPELNSRSKSRSLLTVTTRHTPEAPLHAKHHLKTVSTSQPRPKVDAPDWIKKVFSAAKKGEVDKLREGLKDIDSALVRNLSDDHGNNLWHICSAQNHVQCLDWLCSHNQQQVDALKDENKHGFTPVALAVKHGSLLSVQWLVHNTVSKAQLSATGNARSLLHIAAKYGQETTVQWLLSYMHSQEINVNGPDSEGNTALHLAAKHGHINCVKALIFQNGNLKVRNERGLKPINLSVKYSQVNCADYLLAMESCYNLAALNIKQQSELQQLQKENAEVKSYFKELLTLTKRLQHRQRELVQTFTRGEHSGQFDSNLSDRNDKHSKYMDEYSQLLAAVIADEERRLLVVEDRWKISRKQPKLAECKKLPLDVIRSQFTHILEKVTDQSPAVPSTPETSDDSWPSGEEDASSSLLQDEPAANISSTPDVIHTLPTQHVPYMGTGRQQSFSENKSFTNKYTDAVFKNKSCDISFQKTKPSNDTKANSVRSISGSARDVNLQVFFKQNPNLRQTSETCSVLEVLEPSSSDSDECINSKRNTVNNLKNEDELFQSSSSSAAETLSPSSCGPSSTGSKKSGSRSSSNGSKRDVSGARSNNIPIIHLSGSGTRSVGESIENKSPDGASNSGPADVLSRSLSHIVNFESNCSAEPDLIRGTQKKKRTPPSLQSNREEPQLKECNTKEILTDNPSISTEDSESLEADRSFSSAIDGPESLLSGPMISDSSVTGVGVKKKGFLLKFSLRGRWPSKYSRPRSSKNEISAEEFRETYSRSCENAQSPSQSSATTSSAIKKRSPLPVKEPEKSQELSATFDNSCSVSRGLENGSTFPTCGDLSRTGIQLSTVGLLPPRREPPPVPPRPPREAEPPQIIPGDDMQIGTINSSSSCVTSCMTESAVSLHDPYMTNSSSNLWQSPDTKSMFRPASSASRVESMSRVDDNFPLNKSSSASTEMLSALDSSTAGRQSPAPSEVSKTESALSPPSDVSKTESTRYLSQLGRIEESNHLSAIKASSLQKTVTDDQTVVGDCSLKDERSEIKPKKKSMNSKKHNPDKPWYEFSDEEDVITPQRYEVMSGRMRSSSEDEEVLTS